MGDLNVTALIGLIIRAFSTAVVLFYVIPKQFKEVLRPKDWLTGLRWRLLALFGISAFSAIPTLTYQAIRSMGGDSDTLRGVATITGSLSVLATTWLLVEVYRYRKKDDQDHSDTDKE